MQLKTTFAICLLLLSLVTQTVSGRQAKGKIPSREKALSSIDSLLNADMNKNAIPGLAYVIVKGDSIFLMGGHGFANLEEQKQVQPRSTLFLMGSNAKPVTAMAVMLLVEKGKVDLDTDVNRYLKSFQLPFTVTLRQLLTHTAGLEEQNFNRVRPSAEALTPLAYYLEHHMPAQIFEPGTVGAYSNHGMAVAGLVVEEVSGTAFELFVQEHIFTPLNMSASSFRIARENMAKSYDMRNAQWLPEAPEYVRTVPSSMLVSTVSDMAHFMIAQLNTGQFESNQVINPSTLAEMQSRQFTHHLSQPGRALGFFEAVDRGKKVLTHGGSRQSHRSYMYMIPEEKLGIYIAYNGGSGAFRNIMANFIADMWLSDAPEPTATFVKGGSDLSEFTGTYYSNRRNETSIERLIQQFITPKTRIIQSSDSTIRLFGANFQLQSEDQFNISSGSFPIAFGRNKSGKVQYLFLQGRSDSYQLFPWYKAESLHAAILVTCLLLFLVISIRVIWTLMKKKEISPTQRSTNWLSVNYLIFLLSFIITVAVLQERLQYATPVIFYFSFSLPILGLLLTIWHIRNMIKHWSAKKRRPRIYSLIYLFVLVVFNLELHYWNLLGFNF